MYHILILAGGRGERMNSQRPKVLHKIKGICILNHLLESITQICPNPFIVIGYRGCDIIMETKNKFHYIWQNEQLGTGHAAKCAKRDLISQEFKHIVIVPGNHPFLSKNTISKLVDACSVENTVISMATFNVPSYINDYEPFFCCPRVKRNIYSEVQRIIEIGEATQEEKLIKEVSANLFCFEAAWLWKNIESLERNNISQEYHLADMIRIALLQKKAVNWVQLEDIKEGLGIVTSAHLEAAEKYLPY